MSPRVIGLLRGLGLAVLSAVLLAVASWLEIADLPAAWAVYAPVLVLVLRSIEAEVLDQPKGPPSESQQHFDPYPDKPEIDR